MNAIKVKAIAPLVGRYRSLSDSALEMFSNRGASAELLELSGLEQISLEV